MLPSLTPKSVSPSSNQKVLPAFSTIRRRCSERALRANASRLRAQEFPTIRTDAPFPHCRLLPLASSLTSHFDVSRIPENVEVPLSLSLWDLNVWNVAKRMEPLERLERTDPHDERSAVVEQLERFEQASDLW